MVEVEVLVKNVEATRLSEQPADETSVTFDVAASLAETDHQAGQFTLKYSIAITSQPPVGRMAFGGSASTMGEEAETGPLQKTPDQTPPPPVFMSIYQKVYAILYLLSGSLKIPYPSPGLMKVVRMPSANEIAASPKAEEKPQPISA